MKLFVDDIRNPKTDGWVIFRSSKTTIKYMSYYGCPKYISFDHDLGGDDTSMIIVKWMIKTDLNSNFNFIPNDFKFNVHSANPVGSKNIEEYFNSYLTFIKGEKCQ